MTTPPHPLLSPPFSQQTPDLPEGGWRPIESAPRDGTVIMLSRPFWTVPFVGRWTTSKHGEGWHDDNVDEGPLLSPMTHWQPLPPPPTVSREGA